MGEIKIMVVEDEAITAIDIQKQLQNLSYNVPAVISSGEEAIEMAKKLQPNLILMDISLKGKMDGTEAAQKIVRHRPVPIVFITAYSDDKTLNQAKLSDPFGYLTKPFEPRDLRIAVELALFKHGTQQKVICAEKRYHTIMQSASCGVVVHNKHGVMTEINDEAERIFGLEKSKITANTLSQFLIPSENSYADVQFQKLLTEKTVAPNLYHIQRPDGNIREVEISSVYIADEEIMLSILNDITEKNRLRSQTLLNDKLAAVGALATSVIHEINNPVTWILNNLDYFKEKLPLLQSIDPTKKNLPEKLLEMIDESIEGAHRIKNIVQDMKGFARADSEEITPVDVHKALKQAIHIAEPQYKKIATLETTFSEGVPLLLLNNTKLQQVFLNLIVNASQAMDANTFSDNKIKIITSLVENRVCIAISDTGRGIPAEVLPKIFEPFFTTKAAGKGTGLGLSISYDIINNLGGEVHVDSVLDQGTTFFIYLPLKLKADHGEASSERVTTMQDRYKILVVDDDSFMLIVTKHILNKYHDITTSNAREALELLNKERFDFIISDLDMVDINGMDLHRYIAKHYVGLENLMIFLTEGLSGTKLIEFVQGIKNPVLDKSFTLDQLQQAINKILPSG